ncbi:MAG: Hpt domain-containing protein [Paracoccaceae bacterium]|uniref:Hpt domain-containing protein n=1 Tax=Seohaeicola saemankumensis TaxID=481181 RepID=UPI001E2A16B8|nr:Hpt domain-containing protein [Seohaeicola saemankumensis]MCD1625751.1 Hpt domain-containing protein [Seohaeicola saemankumensis]
MNANAARKVPDGLPDMLHAAHQVFVNLTTDRILRIEALKEAVHKGEEPVPSLTEIAQISHKIAGVAGTLGYPDIGDRARSVEQRLKSDLGTDEPLRSWSTIAPDIEALLDALEELL